MRSRINSADGLTDGRRYRAYAQYPSVPLLPDRRVRIRGTLTDDTVWPFELDSHCHNCGCVNARPAAHQIMRPVGPDGNTVHDPGGGSGWSGWADAASSARIAPSRSRASAIEPTTHCRAEPPSASMRMRRPPASRHALTTITWYLGGSMPRASQGCVSPSSIWCCAGAGPLTLVHTAVLHDMAER